MREARRTAVWLLILVSVGFAGDRAGAWVCGRLLVSSGFRFSRIYRGGMKTDTLVIGDSRGVHSFYSPAIESRTGRTAFNLSYNSMSVPIAEALLADYLDRNPPPRLVIIEPTCVGAERSFIEELRTFGGLSKRLASLDQREHPGAAARNRLFRLLAYNSEFFLRALVYLRRSDQDWIHRNVIGAELLAVPKEKWSPRLSAANLALLTRTVRMLEGRGIEVRLVIAPYHPASGIEMEAVAGQLARIAPVWNYAGAIREPRYFSDTVHMNLDGANQLLELLCRDRVLACRM